MLISSSPVQGGLGVSHWARSMGHYLMRCDYLPHEVHFVFGAHFRCWKSLKEGLFKLVHFPSLNLLLFHDVATVWFLAAFKANFCALTDDGQKGMFLHRQPYSAFFFLFNLFTSDMWRSLFQLLNYSLASPNQRIAVNNGLTLCFVPGNPKIPLKSLIVGVM